MTEKTTALMLFTCNIKYDIKYLFDKYKISHKHNEELFVFVEEPEFYGVLEDISDMTYDQFETYVKGNK